MNDKTVDIADVLSTHLGSREQARRLKVLVDKTRDGETAIVLDFARVDFASRGFMDEFYNLFLKTPTTNPYTVTVQNLSHDLTLMLDAVSRTQHGRKSAPCCEIEPQVRRFNNVQQLIEFFDKEECRQRK